ncbi:hypothetical protein Hte_008309 [Hypoxylon texense]
MAEFASAIIGLAAAGAKVGTTLDDLIDTLKDAPSELLALSDEATDFRAIVARLVEARESGEFLTRLLLTPTESSNARNGIRISHLEMKVAEATQRQLFMLEKHDSMLIELTMSEKRGLDQVRPAIEGKLSGNLQPRTGDLTFPNESLRTVQVTSFSAAPACRGVSQESPNAASRPADEAVE